jgi:hypothetical protein
VSEGREDEGVVVQDRSN